MDNFSGTVEPKTPKRTRRTSTTDYESAQTPRRSARKSIKTVQEYESIVAQKGVKRIAMQEDEDSAAEVHWEPAVIGRASTKRGKRAARGKGKNLKRQRKLTEESEDNDEENCEVKKNETESDAVVDEVKDVIIEENLTTEEDVELEKKDDVIKEQTDQASDELLTERNVDNKIEEKSKEGSIDEQKVGENDGASLKADDAAERQENIASEPGDGECKIPEQDEPVVDENMATDDPVENQESLVEVKNSVEDVPEDVANEQENLVEAGNKAKILDDDQSQEDAEAVRDTDEISKDKQEACADSTSVEQAATESVEESVSKELVNIEQNQSESPGKLMEADSEMSENPKEEEEKKAPKKEPDADTESMDTSTEGGDEELAAMPITADDCMDSPIKAPQIAVTDVQLNNKLLSPAADQDADDSDCFMLSMDEGPSSDDAETEEPTKGDKALNVSTNSTDMPSLVVYSDDEGEETDKPKEVREAENEAEEKDKLHSTFDADESPGKTTDTEVPPTPKLRPSISHVPTPFKLKTPVIPDIVIEPEDELEDEEPPMMLEETKDKQIKSSRKRSISISEDRPKRNVTFYSPANTTFAIYDGDLTSGYQKADPLKSSRKRSLSVTETVNEMVEYIKQKKVPSTPDNKKKQPQSITKTEMPNFAAIHKQQFRKMESIADHVARKAERAKVLTNSALKAKPASVQKGLSVNNSILRDCNKDKESKVTTSMPKARQRIDLNGVEHKPKPIQTGWLNVSMKMRAKSRNDLLALDDFSSINKVNKFNASRSAISKPKLPNPRIDTTVSSTSKTAALPSDARPKFNLSTAAERSTETLDDRRKRLMNMYKSRAAPRPGEKNRDILKGVRTNRRFELQMMCRNRQN